MNFPVKGQPGLRETLAWPKGDFVWVKVSLYTRHNGKAYIYKTDKDMKAPIMFIIIHDATWLLIRSWKSSFCYRGSVSYFMYMRSINMCCQNVQTLKNEIII